jgi:hypothetical protein
VYNFLDGAQLNIFEDDSGSATRRAWGAHRRRSGVGTTIHKREQL